MTKSNIIAQLESLIGDRKSFLDEDGQGEDIYLNDISALTAAIEAISKTTSSEKLYTVFDVIRLVQRVVSNETCGMSADDTELCIAYEIERGIISELVNSRVGKGGHNK